MRFNVGAALTVVTCLIIAVGVVAVRRLTGDSPPRTLRLGTPSVTPPSEPAEVAPHVLRPHDATTDSTTATPLGVEPTIGRRELIRVPDGGGELRPIPLRTATQPAPQRYR